MSEYAGCETTHTKRRGKIRRCSWCGQGINVGERYCKWLWFDGGDRSTVYAHEVCAKGWQRETKREREVVYADGENEKPEMCPACYGFGGDETGTCEECEGFGIA